MTSDDFQLWLEFEEYEEGEEWDVDSDYFNMVVTIADRQYALNVWSFGYMRRLLVDGADLDTDVMAFGYSHAPDLLVQTCSRAHMEKVIRHMIDTDSLKDSWLVEHDDQA